MFIEIQKQQLYRPSYNNFSLGIPNCDSLCHCCLE